MKSKGAKKAKKIGSGKSIIPEFNCGCARPKSSIRLAMCLANKAHRQHLRVLAEYWELMTDAVSVADAETGLLLYVNGAWRRLYGFSYNMALGSQVEDLLNPEKLTKTLQNEIRAATLQGHWCGRLLNRDARGREFPVDLSTGIVTTAVGELIGLLGVSTPLRGGTVTDEKINRLVMRHQETLSRELKKLLESTLFNRELVSNGNDHSNGHVQGIDRLSPREQQVFDLIGQGLSTSQIARKLKVSHYTIQAHRNHIREKLDIRDSATLTFRAYHWSRRNKKNKTSNGSAK